MNATLYEHEDGRFAVWPGTASPPWANGDPKWHRVGPVDVSALAAQADDFESWWRSYLVPHGAGTKRVALDAYSAGTATAPALDLLRRTWKPLTTRNVDSMSAEAIALDIAEAVSRADADKRDALPTIKGVSIGGGYVVVTPAGWGEDKAYAVRDAILRLFPVNPASTPRPDAALKKGAA